MKEGKQMSETELEKKPTEIDFDQAKELQQPIEANEKEINQPTSSTSGCFIRILIFFVGVVAITVGKYVAEYALTKHVISSSQKSYSTFNDEWNKISKQFADGWPSVVDKIIALHVEEAKTHYAKQGYTLTQEDIEKLESLLRSAFANFDPEQYMRKNKATFLKKIGKSEEELNRISTASCSKEDMEALNRQMRNAAGDIGFDAHREFDKSLIEAVDSFMQYMDEKIKKQSNI